ncbi:MAG TPA: phosphodiester glycosidase family protein [Mucilaginibacter sp.]
MFKDNNSPVGLFIQRRVTISPLDTSSGDGNFYLKPNGVFYLAKDNKATICPTKDFRNSDQITFATQSGPMLLINGTIHPAFKEGSTNVNVRNAVGILPDGRIVFAMSKDAINFYDFAEYFKNMGLKASRKNVTVVNKKQLLFLNRETYEKVKIY